MSIVRDWVTKEMQQTSKIITEFPWEDPKAYAMWLVQTFHMVNHSTRLVALAGAYTPIHQNNLHARFVDHSAEERGHEKVCISDLKALGYEVADFPQLYQSASMYQVQYFWIQHRGPTSFFGYTLALECLAEHFGPDLYRRTKEAHGEKAAKFLKLHSAEDIEHIQAAFQQIETLTPDELKLVHENLELSSGLYRSMLVDVAAMAKGFQKKKSA